LNRRVIRKSDRANYFFRFNLDSLLRGDTQARAQYYSQMLNAGVMSLDEVRRLENMNPIADGLGKKHYIQVNMTTLENLQAPNNDSQQ
jgi:phage portal protein BeeE